MSKTKLALFIIGLFVIIGISLGLFALVKSYNKHQDRENANIKASLVKEAADAVLYKNINGTINGFAFSYQIKDSGKICDDPVVNFSPSGKKLAVFGKACYSNRERYGYDLYYCGDTDGNFDTDIDNKYIEGGNYSCSGLNNEIIIDNTKPLKSIGTACTTSMECSDGSSNGISYGGGFCNAGVCTNPWISGPCTGIYVYKSDQPGEYRWMTYISSSSSCVEPQCTKDLDLKYPSKYSLAVDNKIDFSNYPARNSCKGIGGHLPNQSELLCMYNNRSSYEIYSPFESYGHWSSIGSDFNMFWARAYKVNFNANTLPDPYWVNSSLAVRCVREQ